MFGEPALFFIYIWHIAPFAIDIYWVNPTSISQEKLQGEAGLLVPFDLALGHEENK